SGMYVDFSGTVAQVEQSFGTEIHDLRTPTGEQRYSAMRAAQIPEALAPLVTGFLALSDIRPHPMMVHAQAPVGQAKSVNGNAAPLDTSGGNYYVGAQDFYTIYNENPLLNAGVNGSGITVALLEETDINTADVTAFRTMLGVTPATPSLTVQHGSASVAC